MYAIKLNRDDILVQDVLVEDILNALPGSFRYRVSMSPLPRGVLIAENGHATISMQTIQDDLWLFISPKSNSGISKHAARMYYSTLKDALADIVLNFAVPA
jgi:hypothetical protein